MWRLNLSLIGCMAMACVGLSFVPLKTGAPYISPPERFAITGLVVNATPDLSEAMFARLAASESDLGLKRVLSEMYADRAAANATVRLTGESLAKAVASDGDGRFAFAGLPPGPYLLTAVGVQQPGTASAGMQAQGARQVRLEGNVDNVKVIIRADFVSVRGRIIDARGFPVIGARIIGEPFPLPELSEAGSRYPTRFAVSMEDGTYELRELAPPDIYRVAAFLNGGILYAEGQDPFYVDIHVRAEGFHEGAVRVALVTENLLVSARRLLQIMARLEASSTGLSSIREKEGVVRPVSTGNTITGIDIALKQEVPSQQ